MINALVEHFEKRPGDAFDRKPPKTEERKRQRVRAAFPIDSNFEKRKLRLSLSIQIYLVCRPEKEIKRGLSNDVPGVLAWKLIKFYVEVTKLRLELIHFTTIQNKSV